jgi:hypothetical protein
MSCLHSRFEGGCNRQPSMKEAETAVLKKHWGKQTRLVTCILKNFINNKNSFEIHSSNADLLYVQ